MENTILDAALSHGIWAVIAVFLLIYIIRSNDQRDARQEENEKSYQAMLNDLTGKYDLLERVQAEITEIRNWIVSHKFSKGGEDGREEEKK